MQFKKKLYVSHIIRVTCLHLCKLYFLQITSRFPTSFIFRCCYYLIIAWAKPSGLLGKIKLWLSKKPLPSPTDRKKFDHDFAISTSFHGLHNIVRNRSKIRKVIWLVVVLGSVSLVVWQIYSRLVNYFTWPTTTSVEVQYVEKIEFPAVTFCNLNR